MERKDKKNEKKKTRPATKKKQTKEGKRTAGPRATKIIETELALVDEKLHKMSDLLGDLPQGICFFNKEDVIKYCNASFTVITGCDEESLKGKKLKKNQLWGGRGQKDEFKELFQKVKEAGSPLPVSMLPINSSKVGQRTWNLNLIPQKDDAGDYDGMELIIEDITGKKPSPDDSLFQAFYDVAVLHSEMQPLLDNLVSVLKDYSGCSSVQIFVVDRILDRLYRADSDNRAGLWDAYGSLTPAQIDNIFNNAENLAEEYRTKSGSIHLKNISETEALLTGILKDIVVDSSNSHSLISMALIPIRYEGWIKGFVQIANTHGEVGAETVAMVENAGNQLHLILEHAGFKEEMRTQREGLLKQMNERNTHLETLSERLKEEIAEREKAQDEMRVQRDLAMALNEIDNLDEALKLCLDTAIKVAEMDSGRIYLIDKATQDTELACYRGLSPDFIDKIKRYDRNSTSVSMMLAGKPMYFTTTEVRDQEIAARLAEEKITTVGFIPVTYENEVMGALNISSHAVEKISYGARNAVEAIAAEIGALLTRIQDRNAYRESEERYKTLFETTSNPILVIDEDGNYIDANDAALAFMECSREELLAMNVKDTLPPYLNDEWFEKYRAIWQAGGSVERDYYVWGKIKVLELTLTRHQMGDRTVIFGIGKDITEKKRVENELRQSEERHRRHFENVNDVIYTLDTEMKITDISPSVEKVLGYKPEEIIGRIVTDLNVIAPESLEEALNNSLRVFNGEIMESTEYKLFHRNGSIIWTEISGAPLYDDSKIIGSISVARDITDRKKAEDAVKTSEEKYRTILEEMDEAYYEIDKEGNFTSANEAMARRFGYSQEELIGLSYKTVTREEEAGSRAAILSKVFQTGRPRFWQPLTGVKKDGTIIYVEDSIYPLKNEAGEVIGLRGIGRDVTERRLWEAALKESEEKFRRLFYQSPIGASMVSLDDYHFIAVNEAFCSFSGYEDEELLSKSFADITHPDYIDVELENIGKLVRGEIDQYINDKQYIRKDGSAVWGHISIRLIKDPSGKPLYLLPVIEDITARKQAEQALTTSEAMFKNIIEHSNEMFYIHNTDYKFIYISPQVEVLTGFTPDEASEVFLQSITDHPMNEDARRSTERAFKTGQKQPPYLMEILKKDGSRAILEFNETPLRDDQGKIIGMTGIARDITLKKKAEDEIRVSEERFKSIVEHIDEVFFIQDEHNKHIYVSPQCEKLIGFTMEELNDNWGNMLIDSPVNQLALKSVKEAVRTGKKQPPYLFEYRSKEGRTVLVEVNETPIVDEAGEFKGFIGAVRDVTERKAMEQALIESEAKFRDIVEASPDPIWEIDISGNITYASPRITESLGLSPSEALGESIYSFVTPDIEEEIRTKFLEAKAADATVVTLQINAITRDNRSVVLEIRAAPIRDSQGQKKGFRGLSRDITESIKAEKTLQESEEKYRSVVENANEGIFVFQGSQFKYANDRLIRFSKYERDELRQLMKEDPFKLIVHPDDLQMVTQKSAKRQSGENVPDQYEIRWIDKDGEVKWASINITSFTWEGKPASLGFVTDITGRKKIEKALAASEDKYRTVLDEMDEFYWEMDLDWNFTFVNDATERIYGYSRNEMIGMNMNVCCPPENLEKRVNDLARAANTGQPLYWQVVAHIKKDGSRLFLETSILPARNDKGEVTGLRGIGRDITERVKTEEELQKRSLLLDSAYDSIVAYGRDGNIVYANESACSSRGYTREEMLKMNVRQLVPEAGLPKLEERILMIDRQGELIYETNHITKDGTVFQVEAYTRMIKTSGKDTIISVYRDITLRRKAEQDLKNSEAKFRSLADMLPLVIFEEDTQGKLTYINNRALELFGYSRDEMLNEIAISQLLDPSSISAARESLKAILRGDIVEPGEYIFVKKDGSRFEGVVYNNRLLDGDRVTGMRGVLVDVSSLRRAEQILSESEEKYRSVIENAGEGIYIIQDGIITYCNERAVELSGYTAEELKSRPIGEFIHPEDRERIMKNYRARVVGEDVPDYYTFRLITKPNVVKTMGLRATRIQWEGKPATLNFAIDVTEIAKAENALKESEQRYRLLAENSMDVIMTISMDMEITYISPSVRYLIGRTSEEILKMYGEGTLSAEVVGLSTSDAGRAVKGIKTLIQDPSRTQVFEFAFKHRDGFTSWAEVKMSMMRDKNGQAAGVLGVIRDVTQQKKMTERLIRSDRLASLGEMAAGLAHEVNNPLTAVMGFAYLVQQNPNTPPEIMKDINSIYNEGKRAADVIKNFLIFARGRKPEKQAVFINDIIESTLRLRHSQMTKENITVLLNLAEDLQAINGDVSQLQQVFLNIILNAEHFMYQTNKKGTLAITTKQDEERIKIIITDDGPGIAQDKVGRVFDPFYTTKQVGEGTGLGLSICHGIISEHGGSIYAESRPGEGATFIIDLPGGN